MAKESKEEFFVGLEGAKDIRRNVLESSREMVHIMQSYEKVKEIRAEKLRRIEQLKTVLEELKLLSSKLSRELPSVQTRTIEVKEAKKKKETKRAKTKKEKKEEDRKDLEKLETDLASIEARLSELK